ncbi:bifunctional [glutamine synthetase] adenylyltransferase/[glutamine synthetase]-adenylyl-L-tyrosine phosphorylase [Humibacter ginsenosidimutans]|uniref:Bifunctional [glutamine synthetase] adenylyltransferase/[glutamine synthetase]-adenylyl-L-tyrosine phosphorylase n=1 Tax=Humibacter ginsenosidimutans TaxID=2599293 RepID=A0A5B8M0V6_9MICO|nr:bifunctional [glutamine synthetase] adenylyltransferase/[glutamine synthetase]-adenylyl-L-tyrosine phosphorylase [Humibacter ginsenosidimutans]QDZ13896.1 bifunctional [glutamine synthetase] adenylyltransferase/[glutamine synthetase]-adenylyl-L-tyrosine phosphorylase [Humibacter ginsenosidimutans]
MPSITLTELARAGFVGLSDARARLDEVQSLGGPAPTVVIGAITKAADPDAALERLLELLHRRPDEAAATFTDEDALQRLLLVLGSSSGLAEFLCRAPDALAVFGHPADVLPTEAELRTDLLDAVGARDGVASLDGEDAWRALRVRYRTRLTEIALHDLTQADPVSGLDAVARTLAALAGAALDASLAAARHTASTAGPGGFSPQDVAGTKLTVIGMGKTGAEELNYLSDVDVIFVVEGDDDAGVSAARAVDVGTRLASLTMRGIDSMEIEPPLWEVDANLRPEGKDGALVRTLESHLAYYERWAKDWEFQALLKARPIAGDVELGHRYIAALTPAVWASAARDGFVDSVQRMRERVTANIPADEVDRQLKLGPGGLRDIEFTVQLLQLVHGHTDASVRVAGTLPALQALAAGGYIGREEAAEFARDYRVLRLLEHRIQLRELRRSHLMPRDEDQLRTLARGTGLAAGARELVAVWGDVKRRVRGLHERLFYRPLLAAVAALPGDEATLTGEQAEARLAAIGFVDPHGALGHIAALTAGVSRRAAIQRTLLPVLLQWFADGADPDYGLLTFRRLSEDLGSTHWFLRMLRDSSGAAEHLTRILAGSRFAGELLGLIPESVAWLDDDDNLRPRSRKALDDEVAAILDRYDDPDASARAIRAVRRREMLRLAFAGILDVGTVEEIAHALTDISEITIAGVLTAIRAAEPAPIEFAVIAMGRFGGRELGFGSDADVIYVFRPREGADPDATHTAALKYVAELKRLTEDARLPFDLDMDLRPEGRNGTPARSLESYRAYYRRWSLTWEAQALLRARGVAGDRTLLDDFGELADEVRYPIAIGDKDVREVKRIKARVENERLPQGVDPTRHLKLGRGSLSDVEWLVQLQQLEHAHDAAALRTTSTLEALSACVDLGYLERADAERLRDAWLLASRARSALTLWADKTSDVLPADRKALDGIARLLGHPRGCATLFEEEYLAVTRRARTVFERNFYDS